MNAIHALATVAIVEAIVIIALVATDKRVVVVPSRLVPATRSPLELAIEYESPSSKFDELVKGHPTLLRGDQSDSSTRPILATCALLNRTNYVRILITNGGDSDEAVRSLQEIGAVDAINLIRQVQSENSSETDP